MNVGLLVTNGHCISGQAAPPENDSVEQPQVASIYNSSNLCLSVCMRPPFHDDLQSDLIETCQEYCRGPADVPFT